RANLRRVILERQINVPRARAGAVGDLPLHPDEREVPFHGVLYLPRKLGDGDDFGRLIHVINTFFRYCTPRATSPDRSSPCVRFTVTQPRYSISSRSGRISTHSTSPRPSATSSPPASTSRIASRAVQWMTRPCRARKAAAGLCPAITKTAGSKSIPSGPVLIAPINSASASGVSCVGVIASVAPIWLP